MANVNIAEKTTLVHGVWDIYRNAMYHNENPLFAQKGTLLYIAEESYANLIDKLKQEGFELKHTTKNRRTGNNIFYYVRSTQEENHV